MSGQDHTYHLLDDSVNKALIGLTINMPTIMIGKMEIEFPAMYMITMFIGTW